MKALLPFVALAALAACNQSQSDAGPVEKAAAADPAPQPTSQAKAGTFSVTQADGAKVTMVMGADHTYTNTVGGQKIEAGIWSIVGGKTCLTPSEGAGAVARCYIDGPVGEDGTFTATPDQGNPVTVKKIA
jgi:hypothetical protein